MYKWILTTLIWAPQKQNKVRNPDFPQWERRRHHMDYGRPRHSLLDFLVRAEFPLFICRSENTPSLLRLDLKSHSVDFRLIIHHEVQNSPSPHKKMLSEHSISRLNPLFELLQLQQLINAFLYRLFPPTPKTFLILSASHSLLLTFFFLLLSPFSIFPSDLALCWHAFQ